MQFLMEIFLMDIACLKHDRGQNRLSARRHYYREILRFRSDVHGRLAYYRIDAKILNLSCLLSNVISENYSKSFSWTHIEPYPSLKHEHQFN